MAQVYLRMFRVDKALEEWTLMKEIDEDSTLTQLTLGFIDLAQVRTPARPDLSFPHCCPDPQSCFTG